MSNIRVKSELKLNASMRALMLLRSIISCQLNMLSPRTFTLFTKPIELINFLLNTENTDKISMIMTMNLEHLNVKSETLTRT